MRIQFYTMKKYGCWFLFCLPLVSLSQSVSDRMAKAINSLEKDTQFKHAAISIYVVESKTGKLVFDKNAELGLVPASCQKVITSAAAFELLGNNYRFKTELGYDGEIKDSTLNGNLYIVGYGDPTLGSWRWTNTKEEVILKKISAAITAAKIKKIEGNVFGYDRKWESNTTPGGWVWEDIGNYYGAGASALNWRENQYDLILKPGQKVGDAVTIAGMKPKLLDVGLYSEVTTGEKGSGDNAYIYLAPYSIYGFVRGSIPLSENNFTISGAMPDPAGQLVNTIVEKLKEQNAEGILYAGSYNGIEVDKKNLPINPAIFFTHLSPSLDSINYWFLKKSINLYGEAFVKAIAYEKISFGSTEKGIELINNFWSKNGIEKSALNMKDGSGLSPSNRVTTKALVTVLQFAKQQKWFPSFYNALPEMNGIKMKDGYIGGVRSYTGYIKSKNGTEYTFAFIANNFDGSPATVREKMWQVLNILK